MKELIVGILLLILTGGGVHAKTIVWEPKTSTLFRVNSGNITTSIYVPHSIHRHKTFYKRKKLHRKEHRRVPRDTSQSMGGLVTVPTAANISITVASSLASQFQGFVKDLVNEGYTPKQIHCWAPFGTHVKNSNHYHGGACDFDQTGWGRTSSQMHHVRDLSEKWNLRDGCSFRLPDCGHIDDGTNIGWNHPHNLIARYIDYVQTPTKKEKTPAFEE